MTSIPGEAHPCLRLRRCVTPSECDLQLLDWDAADTKGACARCPYNPLLDVLAADREDEPP